MRSGSDERVSGTDTTACTSNAQLGRPGRSASVDLAESSG